MTVTGINFTFMILSPIADHAYENEIPFTGDEPELTETVRATHGIEINKYKLSQETTGKFRALIDKYGITSWAGITPSAPKVNEGKNTIVSSLLTLRFDDGSSSVITFREKDDKTGAEAAEEFRKAVVEAKNGDNKISSEKIYPNLKACREIKEDHGPVVAVETGSSSSGMMMGSNESYYQTVEKIGGKDGTVRVTIRRKRGNGPEVTCTKETESDIFSKVQEISDKENLPGWHYAAVDPSIPVDRSMMPTDYTSSGWLNIYYDDSLITGCPRIMRTIGKTAREMGGAEVDDRITELINECVTKSGAKVELSNDNPFLAGAQPLTNDPMTAFMGMKAMQAAAYGTWDCSCGAKGLTTKFCPECGFPRS